MVDFPASYVSLQECIRFLLLFVVCCVLFVVCWRGGLTTDWNRRLFGIWSLLEHFTASFHLHLQNGFIGSWAPFGRSKPIFPRPRGWISRTTKKNTQNLKTWPNWTPPTSAFFFGCFVLCALGSGIAAKNHDDKNWSRWKEAVCKSVFLFSFSSPVIFRLWCFFPNKLKGDTCWATCWGYPLMPTWSGAPFHPRATWRWRPIPKAAVAAGWWWILMQADMEGRLGIFSSEVFLEIYNTCRFVVVLESLFASISVKILGCLLKLIWFYHIFEGSLPKASCKLEKVHRFHRYSYLSGVDDAFALCMALKSATQSKLSEGDKRHW